MAQPVENIQEYDDWGDEVDSDDETGVSDVPGSEGVNAYWGNPPACYPVTVGEIIQGGGKSYRIEHRLGFGGFSTVWLAFNLEERISVTLKILTASKDSQTEVSIHRNLHQTIPEPANLLLSLSTFTLPGRFPDKFHGVIVLPIVGPNLHTYMDLCRPLDSPTALRLALDVLKAVACLHMHGFIHRGMWTGPT